MGGSLGFGESDSGSQSSYKQEVYGPWGDAFEGLIGQASGLFNQTNSGMQGRIPGAADNMNQISDQTNPYWQQAMGGGVYKDMGLQNSLMNSINQSLNQPSAMQEINNMVMGGEGNNYADAMKDQYIQDADRSQQNMLGNLDARAAASGMSGGSRHGVATARGMDDINRNLQSNMAQTGFDTFDKDLDRKLQIASQADQGTLARQGMMQNMLGQQQQTANTGLNYGQNMQNLGMGQFAPYNEPWQALSGLANAIGDPIVLGSGNMSGDSSSKGGNASASLTGK